MKNQTNKFFASTKKFNSTLSLVLMLISMLASLISAQVKAETNNSQSEAVSTEEKPEDLAEINLSDYAISYEQLALQYVKRELKSAPQYFELFWSLQDKEGLRETKNDEFAYKEKAAAKASEYKAALQALPSALTLAITGKFMTYDFQKKAFLVDDFLDSSNSFAVNGLSEATFPVWTIKGKNELPKNFDIRPDKVFTHIPVNEGIAKKLANEMAQSDRKVLALFEIEIAGIDKKSLKNLNILSWIVKIKKVKLYRFQEGGYRLISEFKF